MKIASRATAEGLAGHMWFWQIQQFQISFPRFRKEAFDELPVHVLLSDAFKFIRVVSVLAMKIRANENDINDLLQTFR